VPSQRLNFTNTDPRQMLGVAIRTVVGSHVIPNKRTNYTSVNYTLFNAMSTATKASRICVPVPQSSKSVLLYLGVPSQMVRP